MSSPQVPEIHRDRRVAESFGGDAERYDRTRPAYPDALVQAIIAASPGRHVLDAGCGTGIEARQFRAAGCRVLGVEPDWISCPPRVTSTCCRRTSWRRYWTPWGPRSTRWAAASRCRTPRWRSPRSEPVLPDTTRSPGDRLAGMNQGIAWAGFFGAGHRALSLANLALLAPGHRHAGHVRAEHGSTDDPR